DIVNEELDRLRVLASARQPRERPDDAAAIGTPQRNRDRLPVARQRQYPSRARRLDRVAIPIAGLSDTSHADLDNLTAPVTLDPEAQSVEAAQVGTAFALAPEARGILPHDSGPALDAIGREASADRHLAAVRTAAIALEEIDLVGIAHPS